MENKTGGCHLNRRIPAIVEMADFNINNLDKMYIPGPKFFSKQLLGISDSKVTQIFSVTSPCWLLIGQFLN
jgi:hypothetical protein